MRENFRVRYLVPLLILTILGIAAASWLLAARTQHGVQCPDRIVILRGRGNEPIECICLEGTLATCFSPGS
jgi:hypothetical protein